MVYTLFPDPFVKNQSSAHPLIKSLEPYAVYFYLISKLRATQRY